MKEKYSASRTKGLTKGDARALAALGVEALPAGVRSTKAMRFTLPLALAAKLEAMSKAERDAALKHFLETYGPLPESP